MKRIDLWKLLLVLPLTFTVSTPVFAENAPAAPEPKETAPAAEEVPDSSDDGEAKEKEDKIDREISQLINKLSTIETEEYKNSTQVTQQEQLIKEYYKNEKQIKKNKEVRDEIVDVRSDLQKIKQSIRNNNTDILRMNGTISALQNQKETIEDRIKEVKDLEETHNLFEYYLNSLGRDGVSYELIQKALPMIEGEINNILGPVSYTHLTLRRRLRCRSRWSPYH